jgi:hypothetical protein
MSLVKSKQRVKDHGEVFTPAWLVEEMLAVVARETTRIDSRFLEPACGSGNFLVPVLLKKLEAAKARYGSNDFEFHHHALLALMCVYGIDLLPDNAEECRENLLQAFCDFTCQKEESVLRSAARAVLEDNIVVGDALSIKNSRGEAIKFAEWSYLGKGKYQRRDFQFSELIDMSSFGEGTLFENMEPDEIFRPVRTYGQVNMSEIASLAKAN